MHYNFFCFLGFFLCVFVVFVDPYVYFGSLQQPRINLGSQVTHWGIDRFAIFPIFLFFVFKSAHYTEHTDREHTHTHTAQDPPQNQSIPWSLACLRHKSILLGCVLQHHCAIPSQFRLCMLYAKCIRGLCYIRATQKKKNIKYHLIIDICKYFYCLCFFCSILFCFVASKC